MSNYSYITNFKGRESLVSAGFCARTATFFARIISGCSLHDQRYSVDSLTSDSEVLNKLDSWGVPVPKKLEEALLSDILQWNFGDGNLRSFGRKQGFFGTVSA